MGIGEQFELEKTGRILSEREESSQESSQQTSREDRANAVRFEHTAGCKSGGWGKCDCQGKNRPALT